MCRRCRSDTSDRWCNCPRWSRRRILIDVAGASGTTPRRTTGPVTDAAATHTVLPTGARQRIAGADPALTGLTGRAGVAIVAAGAIGDGCAQAVPPTGLARG